MHTYRVRRLTYCVLTALSALSVVSWFPLLGYGIAPLAAYSTSFPTATIPVQPCIISTEKEAHGIDVNPRTNKVYVANSDNSISVIDGSTDRVADNIMLDQVNDIRRYIQTQVAVNPSTNMVYASNPYSNITTVIDGSTNEVVKEIELAKGHGNSIAVNSNTNMVYVASTDYLNIIDGETNELVSTEPPFLGRHWLIQGDVGQVVPGQIALNPVTNMIYSTNPLYNMVTIIDGNVHEPIANITLPTSPFGIFVDHDRNRIYVSTSSEVTQRGYDFLTLIDGNTNEIIRAINFTNDYISSEYTFPPTSEELSFDPLTGRLYAGSGYLVSVTDLGANESSVSSSMSILTIGQPQGLALDPDTNKLYITAQNPNVIQVANVSEFLLNSTSDKLEETAGPLSEFETSIDTRAHLHDSQCPYDHSMVLETPKITYVNGSDFNEGVAVGDEVKIATLVFDHHSNSPYAISTRVEVIKDENNGNGTVVFSESDNATMTPDGLIEIEKIWMPIEPGLYRIAIYATTTTDGSEYSASSALESIGVESIEESYLQ